MVKKFVLMMLAVLLPVVACAQSVTDVLGWADDYAQTQSAQATAQVIDECGVLTQAQIVEITAEIDRIEADHDVDIVVLVTRRVPYDESDSLWRVRNFADDFYDEGGYGMAADFSGMLYLIDLNNRVQYISTGGVMIQYITDAREEAIFDAAQPYLRSSQWGRAALAAVSRTARFMAQGRQEGTFLYDEATGRRLSGMYNALTGPEVLLALGGGVLAAAVMCGCVAAVYSLKGSTYHYDMAANSSCEMTLDESQFLRQSVSRVARSSGGGGYGGGHGGRSGGSGVHRSSGGRSHGGGGRRF